MSLLSWWKGKPKTEEVNPHEVTRVLHSLLVKMDRELSGTRAELLGLVIALVLQAGGEVSIPEDIMDAGRSPGLDLAYEKIDGALHLRLVPVHLEEEENEDHASEQ